ncbi:MAG: glycosyltransferase [Deltaproteobacteria bacterium]|nr:glycosyltransferase [Deltaproteobacteria bacterium]
MKIVDVCEFYSELGGGVRTYVAQKLAASARAGHQTVIVAPGPADRQEQRDGGRILWVRAPRLLLDPRYHIFCDRKAIHRVLDREAPDVVEGSSPWVGGQAVASWAGAAVKSFFVHQDPVAAYPHTMLAPRLGTQRVDALFGWLWRYMRGLSGRFDTTVVSGQWLAERLTRFGVKSARAIRFGVEPGLFSPALRSLATRRRMLEQCGIGDERALLLVSVGRHHPEKLPGMLIEAVARARRRIPVGLYMIGDGPLRGRVERRAARAGGMCVAGQVAARSRLAGLLASGDGLLHGCPGETFGLAIAEAISAGLPLIVPSTGGAADLAGPGYAETYEPFRVEACAAAIVRFASRDRAAMAAAAAAAAGSCVRPSGEHFTELFAHYAGLIAARRARQHSCVGIVSERPALAVGLQ